MLDPDEATFILLRGRPIFTEIEGQMYQEQLYNYLEFLNKGPYFSKSTFWYKETILGFI